MQRRSSVLNTVSILGAFLASAMVLGVLAAGLFIPAVGLAGNSVKSVVGSFDSLPTQFTVPAQLQQTRILDTTGKRVIATLSDENRQPVSIKYVSAWMKKAQIAIEDDRFYYHGGIDARGIARAFVASAMGRREGASTITQQYVRQTLVQAAERKGDKKAASAAQVQRGIAGVVRKVQEAKYAIGVERRMSKDQILEGYFNIAFYGGGAYGVEAAAERFFGIPASKLNLLQSATLAGLVQRPTYTNPLANPKAALARRNVVLTRMAELKMISAKQLRSLKKAPLGLNPAPAKLNCTYATHPYICDYVAAWLMDQPALGKTRADRRNAIYSNGVQVRTTFDLDVVDKVQARFNRTGYFDSTRRGSAGAIVEVGTGRMIAFAQSTNYKKTAVNWAVDTKYGGGFSRFSVGSTGKLFTLVAALEAGMSGGTIIQVPPGGSFVSPGSFNGDPCHWSSGSWRPDNSEGKEDGARSVREITRMSVNTGFIKMAQEVGACPILRVIDAMGMKTSQGKPYGRMGGSGLVLGSDDTSVLTLASAYATLPAKGLYCPPVPVDAITDATGKRLPLPAIKDRCKVAIDSSVAYDASKILESPFQGGTASRVGRVHGHETAGKTGTADGGAQTSFAGFTSQLAGAVWYGTPTKQFNLHVYGAQVAGPLWSSMMNIATDELGLPSKDFTQGNYSVGQSANPQDEQTVTVPDVTGLRRSTARRHLQAEGFNVVVSDQREPSVDYAFGRVVRTMPAAGASAKKGDTVTLVLSSGSRGAGSGSSPSATAAGVPGGAGGMGTGPAGTTLALGPLWAPQEW